MNTPARITVDLTWPTQPTPELEETITVASLERLEFAIAEVAHGFGAHVVRIFGEWPDPQEQP